MNNNTANLIQTLMKNFKLLMLGAFLLAGMGLQAQQGIGTNNPNDNAALEIESPDKGVLIPRISLTASSTLFAGAAGSVSHTGMLVYNTNKTASETTGLNGEGIYQWRLPIGETDTSAQHYWFKMLTTEDSIVAGTVTNSTLRWDGEFWVENDQLLSSSDQTSITTALLVDSGTTTLTLNNDGLDLNTAGTMTVSATSLTVTGTTTFTDTVTLNKNLIDGFGSAGREGFVLSTTATATRWVDPNTQTIATITDATATPSATIKILLVEPSANDVAITLHPSGDGANEYPAGFALKIRRNWEYSAASSNTVSITPDGTETINGQSSINMNVGYQSVTLYNTGSGWVRIE